MSNARFTPGPWEADGTLVWAQEQYSAPGLWGARRKYADGRLDARGLEDGFSPLLDTDDGEYVKSRNPEADAHLIAAAPELYEALDALMADWPTDHLPARETCLKAATALAKARGEA